MGGGGGEQFLGQKEGRGWLLEKIVGRMGGELFRVGQNRIHRERVFHGQGLSGGARKKQWPK